MSKLDDLVVNEYQLADSNRIGGIVLRRMPQSNGTTLWAIYDGANIALDKDGDWVFEPYPSRRTPEYLALTRYSSAEEALLHWHNHLGD